MATALLGLLGGMLLLGATLAAGAPAIASVVVNGVRLEVDTLRAVERRHGVQVRSGRYWYDRTSGLWGMEGGPAQGRMDAGLRLGGPLQANASQSRTGVFVNGREIHYQELQFLQGCFGWVNPARYWLNAAGIGGYEGGPAQFNVTRCFATGRQGESLLSGYFLTGVSVIGGR
jgi:hypothetical protein